MNKVAAQSKINAYLLIIVIAAAFLLTIRNTGLYPTVFADEYTYSKFSRLLPFEEVNIPGYLYFFTYKVTSLCGDGFLGCARVLNVLFFILAAPFIYLIGRKLTGEKTAALIAVLSIFGPINTYTAYFMPESLYFLSFWLFAYLVSNIKKELAVSRWIFMGAIFGVSALIKPHALFLAPALGIYLPMVQRRSGVETQDMFRYYKYFGFFASAISTKLIIGFALAGNSGITIFGSAYTSIASESMGAGHYIILIKLAFENFQGHILALCLLFSVPVGQLLLTTKFFLRRDSESRTSVNIALYTSLILFSLLIVVGLFTASIAGSGPYESNARLHMRYYNFAFPLLLLVAASQLSLNAISTPIKFRAIIGLPIGVAICYAAYSHLAPYIPSFVDSPELRGFTFNSSVFYVLSGLSLFSTALWVYADRSGAKFFLYLFMPLAVCFSTFYVNQELRQRLVPDVFDKAGMFTKQYLSNEDISKVVVVGSNPAGLFRSLFYLDNSKASLEVISKGSTYDLSKLPADKEWILVIGDHALSDSKFFQLPMNGFTLARAHGSNVIDFKKTVWPGVISSIHGLSSAEPWGTWSASDVVIFEYSMPLPEKFNVHLTAQAFGPNIGKEFEAHVGDRTVKFSLSAVAEEKILEFDNPTGSRILIINVPAPMSPRELSKGLSGDDRSLGVGFVALKIAAF
jgi:phosphoglycerol transferase